MASGMINTCAPVNRIITASHLADVLHNMYWSRWGTELSKDAINENDLFLLKFPFHPTCFWILNGGGEAYVSRWVTECLGYTHIRPYIFLRQRLTPSSGSCFLDSCGLSIVQSLSFRSWLATQPYKPALGWHTIDTKEQNKQSSWAQLKCNVLMRKECDSRGVLQK